MNNKSFIKSLEDIGLTEKEAKVYIAAVSLGPATVLQLSRASDLKRTTIYSVIESLKNYGIMTTSIRGFKQYFVAEDPKTLVGILDRKQESLSQILPDLSGIYNQKGENEFIKVHEGKRASRTVYENLLSEVRPREEYMVISNVDQWYSLDEEFFRKFKKKRAELARTMKFRVRMLLQSSPQAEVFQKNQKNYCEEVKLLPSDISLSTNLVVLPNQIVVQQLTLPITTLVIKNNSIVQMHQEMFEMLWKQV